MPAPVVTQADFELFTGITLSDAEKPRVDVMLGRASRTLWDSVEFPDVPTDDDLAFWSDAVSEMAWYYWEAEKAGAMEILALPVSQLSLGTLFWTKSSDEYGGMGSLWALNRLLSKYGNVKRLRFVLEDELEYPR